MVSPLPLLRRETLLSRLRYSRQGYSIGMDVRGGKRLDWIAVITQALSGGVMFNLKADSPFRLRTFTQLLMASRRESGGAVLLLEDADSAAKTAAGMEHLVPALQPSGSLFAKRLGRLYY